jgi:hypothetical protein
MQLSMFEKLTVGRLLKTYLAYYGTQGLLLCSQKPTTGPYLEPD